MAGVSGAWSTGFSVGVAITAKDMYSRAFAKAQTDLQKLRKFSETEAAKLERSLNIGRTLTTAGATITAASYAIDRALQKPVQTAADFDQALQNIMTLAPMKKGIENAKEFKDELSRTIEDAATTSGKGMIELGNSSYALISGIEDAREGLAAIPAVAKLSRSAMGSTDSAVNVLTNTLNTYGKAWGSTYTAEEKANRITNLYAATAADAKTNLDDLNTAVTYAGPAAIEAGMSLEELLAILGKLQSAGLEASMSGTYVRQMLAAMTKNADKLKDIGVNMYDAEGNARNLIDVFAELGNKTKNMTDQERANVMLDIFDVRGKNAAQVLVALGDGLEETVKRYRAEADATGDASIAQQMFNEAMEGGRAKLERLQAEQEKMEIQIAEKLMPAQIEFQTIMHKGLSAILDLPVVGEVTKWGVAILGVGAQFGKILGPATTLIGLLKQMQAMKKISIALENKGVAEQAGKSMGGAFGSYLAGAAIVIGAATITSAIINKIEKAQTERAGAAFASGDVETARKELKAKESTQLWAGGVSFLGGEFWHELLGMFGGKGKYGEAQRYAKEISYEAKEKGVIKARDLTAMQTVTRERVLPAIEEREKAKAEAAALRSANKITNEEYTKRVNEAQATFDSFIQALHSEIASMTGGVPAKGTSGPPLPSYQSGTLRVPRTGPAMIHEDEMIIPPREAAAIRGGRSSRGGVASPTFSLTVNFHGVNPNNPESITKAINEAFKRWAKGMPLS